MSKSNYEKSFILLFFLVFFYVFYALYAIYSSNVVLADDLAMIYLAKDINQNYFDYIASFVNSSTMSARPVSGFITGTIIFLSQNNDQIYFSGLLFFPLSILTIYFVLNKILAKEIACLVILFYSVSMIGTSIQFSPIMLNSNVATIFYVLSIYFIVVKKNLILSSLLFILSILSYEIFFMGILINILLIKENKKKIIYALLTLGLLLIYRKFAQVYFFTNSYQRDSVSNIFDMQRNFKIIVWSGKMIFRDYFVAIYRSFINIGKISMFEWAIAIFLSYGLFNVLKNFDFHLNSKKIKKVAILAFCGFIFSFGIFIFSTYMPTLFGFENRNLGSVRLFFTISLLCFLLYFIGQTKFKKNGIALVFSIFSLVLIIGNLGVKNSWIYANDFNNNIFRKIKIKLDENNIEKGSVCVDFDVYKEVENNTNFILREPLFFNHWESKELAFKNGIDPKRIIIHNWERQKKCDYQILIKNEKVLIK